MDSFLPNKTTNVGSLNKYYGLFEDGQMKIGGLELRRRDTPQLIKNAQMDMLKVLSRANNAREFCDLIPDVIEVIKKYADRIMNGECDLKELVFTSTISKDLEYYSQLNNNVACLLQLRDNGLEVKPGEHIQYIITNANSRKYGRKVKAWRLADGNEGYDKQKYLSYLLKAGETILSPFGYSERRLAEGLKPSMQVMLHQF